MSAFFKDDVLENKLNEWINLAGLPDLNFGTLFIAYGLTKYFETLGLPPRNMTWIVLALNMIVMYAVRKYIIQPRFGYMKKKSFFSPKINIMHYVFTFLLLLSLNLIMKFHVQLFTDVPFREVRSYSDLGSLICLVISMFLVLPIAQKSIRIRTGLYFPVLLAGLVIAIRLSASLGEVLAYFIGLTVPGILILGFGLREYVRFLKQYPLEEAVANSEYSK